MNLQNLNPVKASQGLMRLIEVAGDSRSFCSSARTSLSVAPAGRWFNSAPLGRVEGQDLPGTP